MDNLDETIAKKLAAKVKSGALTLDEVPPFYKERVKELLNE